MYLSTLYSPPVTALLKVANGMATNVPLPTKLPPVSTGKELTILVDKDFIVFAGDGSVPDSVLRVPR